MRAFRYISCTVSALAAALLCVALAGFATPLIARSQALFRHIPPAIQSASLLGTGAYTLVLHGTGQGCETMIWRGGSAAPASTSVLSTHVSWEGDWNLPLTGEIHPGLYELTCTTGAQAHMIARFYLTTSTSGSPALLELSPAIRRWEPGAPAIAALSIGPEFPSARLFRQPGRPDIVAWQIYRNGQFVARTDSTVGANAPADMNDLAARKESWRIDGTDLHNTVIARLSFGPEGQAPFLLWQDETKETWILPLATAVADPVPILPGQIFYDAGFK